MRLTATRVSRGPRFVSLPLSRAWLGVLVGAALLAVLALDVVTGAAPVQHLYYLPIIAAALGFGRRGALATAAAAIVFYYLAKPRPPVLNYLETDVLQSLVFLAVAVIADRLATDGRRLHHLAMTDDLTGLHNLRSFESRLGAMVRDARDSESPLSLLVLDLDRLKRLNDVYGHLAGAEAVRTVGRILAVRLPVGSAACRYGGDEFVVALPHAAETAAIAVADDLCRAVNAVQPVLAGIPFPVGTLSISVGLASRTFERSETSLDVDAAGEALFSAADRALYLAKAGGRNRISAG